MPHVNETAGRREWIALGVLLLPLLLVSMDVSILYFAVPFITEDLAPTSAQQLWIFDIYGFVLAGTLMTMGSLGDRIGRRRLLLIGAGAFGAASVFAAFSTNPEMLIIARALLGIGGAALMPSTLALIRNMFLDEKQRAIAIAVWATGLTLGVSLGPILSGFLVTYFPWGSVFLVNAPAMVLLLVIAPFLVPEFRDENAGKLDLISAFLSLAAILPVIYAIKQAAENGIDLPLVLTAEAGIVVGIIFVWRQRRIPNPMLDIKLFRRLTFSGSVLTNLFGMFGMVGFTQFTTQYLQSVLGYSPLVAALWSLLPSLGVGLAMPLSGALTERINRAYVIAGAFVLACSGFIVMMQVQADSALWVILVAATCIASGLVVVMSLITDLVVGSAPAEKAGTASALVEASSQLGGSLGMAMLGTLGLFEYRQHLDKSLPDGLGQETIAKIEETLGGAIAVAGQLPGQLGDAVVQAARVSFVQGMHGASILGASVMAGAAIFAALVLRKAAPPEPEIPAGPPADDSPTVIFAAVRSHGPTVRYGPAPTPYGNPSIPQDVIRYPPQPPGTVPPRTGGPATQPQRRQRPPTPQAPPPSSAGSRRPGQAPRTESTVQLGAETGPRPGEVPDERR